MKKRRLYFLGMVLGFSLFLGIENVKAASTKISVSSNKQSVTVGSNVSITYKISSSVAIGAWNYQITTPSNFSFQSCNNGLLTHQVGQVANNSTKSTSVTCTFKAKSAGKGTFGVKNYQVEDFNVNTMATTVGSTTVSVTKTSSSSNNSSNSSNQSENKTYSSNNYLKSLTIEGFELNPTFKKATTTYSLELPADTSEINIRATKEDDKASIAGIGKISVEEGTNKIEVKVTAENGSVKTYTINATVKEKDPIKVVINDEELTVVRKKDNLKAPNNSYKETTVSINNEEVPALYSDITKYTLVGLKDKDGNISLYIYNEKDKSYTLYKELTFKAISLYIIDDDSKIPSKYTKTTLTINNEKITAYKSPENNDFYLIYGINIETGDTNLYQYDDKDKSLQRFIVPDDNNDVKNDNDKIYLYTITGLGGFIVLTYLIILINLIRKSTKNNNIKEVTEIKERKETKDKKETK